MAAAREGIESVPGVEVETLNLHDYNFKVCNACFNCIRSDAHLCTKKDDMGGSGELFAKLLSTNGLLIADPVFLWGSSALVHTFIERMYPFIWSGVGNGMPFASISCASNSGFQHQASKEIAKQVFNFGFSYIGCVPAHVSYLEAAVERARALGAVLGAAAKADMERGRTKLADRDKFAMYAEPWDAASDYFANLTNGDGDYASSMTHTALAQGAFKKERALVALTKADELLESSFENMQRGDRDTAIDLLSDGSALWTEATWREFLEEEVIGVEKPKAYRPVEDLL